MINKDIIEAFSLLAKEKDIDRTNLSTIIEDIFITLIHKRYGEERENFSVIVNMEKGEIEILKIKCADGDKEACAELEKLEKDNEDFLEHLMAIADYDEYPPKLKEPSDKD